MITRVFFHLVDTQHPVAVSWLAQHLGAEYVACLGMSGGKVQVEARREGRTGTWLWSGDDLLQKLSDDVSELSGALAWVLCKFYDIVDESDSMLWNFVNTSVGLAIEPVPFMRKDAYLFMTCDRKSCSGTEKKSASVHVKAENDILRVEIPLGNPDLRELLFGRLRRIEL